MKEFKQHCDTANTTSCLFQPIFLLQDNPNSLIKKEWVVNETLPLAPQLLVYPYWVGTDSSLQGMPRTMMRNLGRNGAIAQPDQDCDQAIRDMGQQSML